MAELAETKSLFMANGFIDENWNLLNWNHRQFLSDSSTDRVRRHRENKALKQDETLQKRPCNGHVTAPDTDTDTDTEKIKNTSKPKASENGFTQKIYQAYPRHVAPKAAFRAIQKVISQNDPQAILETVENFARKHRSLGTESKFIPHPATYFNQGRYADEE